MRLILILSLVNIFLLIFIFNLLKEESYIAFLDIGQGSSVLINNPKLQVLYDVGPYGYKALNELKKLMPFYDKTIEVIIISHPDKDHYGGIFDILKRYKIGIILISPVKSEESGYLTFIEKVKESKIPLLALDEEDLIETNYEKIYVLNPAPKLFKTENQNSLVLKVFKNNKSFLLTGDIDKKVEEYLFNKYKEFLKSDFILIPHHGSKYSSSENFLRLFANSFAIIQVGKNKYGHPHKEVVNILNKLNIKYWRTDLQGTLIIK